MLTGDNLELVMSACDIIAAFCTRLYSLHFLTKTAGQLLVHYSKQDALYNLVCGAYWPLYD